MGVPLARFPAPNLQHTLNTARMSWILGHPAYPFMNASDTVVWDLMMYRIPVKNGIYSHGRFKYNETFSWEFGGGGKAVTVSRNFAVTQRVSFAAWFRVDSNRDYWVFHKGDNSTNADSAFAIGRFGGNLSFLVSDGSAWITAASSATYADGLWYRVAATWDGAAARIYVNGVAVGSQAGSGTVPATATRDWNWGFQGASAAGVVDGIADMSIWNRALTPGEIGQEYIHARLGYTLPNGPLRTTNRQRYFDQSTTTVVNFTTTVGAAPSFVDTTPANFTTTLIPTVAAGGIGPLDPESPAELETVVGYATPFQAGEPTLVNFTTNVSAGETLAAGNPVSFETVVGVNQRLLTIPNGDRRILSQGRYRR